MPVVAVNVIKVLFVLFLYGFLFYVARAMRGHAVEPSTDRAPTQAPRERRRTRAEDSAPPSPRRAWLEIHAVGNAPQNVEVEGIVVVGRGTAADVTIEDEYTSDRHAAFEFDGEMVWVEDLGSTNGTRIGESRIQERTAVPTGTEVLVGRTKVIVR